MEEISRDGPFRMSDKPGSGKRLQSLIADAGEVPLTLDQELRFERYLSLIQHWNGKTNLTSIRDQGGILSRHFVECIAFARLLPPAIQSLLDFGSGAGFPGIPIAICHEDIAVTLAESQGKKAAFLNEAVRALELNAKVHSARAEEQEQVYDAVVLRAVDKMGEAVHSASQLVKAGGWLGLMTSEADRERLIEAAGEGFDWSNPSPLPGSESRQVVFGRKNQ